MALGSQRRDDAVLARLVGLVLASLAIPVVSPSPSACDTAPGWDRSSIFVAAPAGVARLLPAAFGPAARGADELIESGGFATSPTRDAHAPGSASLLALDATDLGPPQLALFGRGKRTPKDKPAPTPDPELPVFNAERAQAFLRSLTVPGWGQVTLGHHTSASVYGLAEIGVWTAFTSFRIQGQLRRDASDRTARLLAGIDLHGRDEEFRRIVGSFLSSDQYNQFVVYRDAANLFLSDPNHPNYAGYRAYIATHSLGERDHWSWDSVESLFKYRGQRKDMQRAQLRANTALVLAGLNRLISAVHAARAAGRPKGPASPRSWNLEVTPTDVQDATAFRLEVRTRF